jgi:hypothetical protein
MNNPFTEREAYEYQQEMRERRFERERQEREDALDFSEENK